MPVVFLAPRQATSPGALSCPGATRVMPTAKPYRRNGFTLIELMVAVAIVAILAKVALPSYLSYIQRSKVPAALDGLSAYALRMEQRYQDVGNYGTTSCAVGLPTVANFSMACSLTSSGQGFITTANGQNSMAGFSYTINHQGTRATTAHPRGIPGTVCWSTRGGSCDT
jgi:type IV pilus assembly protein PilE